MGDGTPQQDALSAILGNRLFQVFAILLSLLVLPVEAITIYRAGQEVLINENIIREGRATAESAEEITMINGNKVGQSASEAAKMKADADSAEYVVQINRNKVDQSLSEATKMRADADSAEATAKINHNKIGNAKADLIKAQERLKLDQDIQRRKRR